MQLVFIYLSCTFDFDFDVLRNFNTLPLKISWYLFLLPLWFLEHPAYSTSVLVGVSFKSIVKVLQYHSSDLKCDHGFHLPTAMNTVFSTCS